MTENAAMNALLAYYLDMLEETFERVQGFYLDRNTSLFETLASIDADTASRPVSARCATLSAQVEHTRFYLDVTIDSMLGNEIGKLDWNEIWRTVNVVTPEEWAQIQARLRASYLRLRELASNPDQWASHEALADAFNGLVHTAYHLGEIRQALCTLG
jgi:hypothetical protein